MAKIRKPPSRRRVHWRVRLLMAEHGVRSVSELVRRLDEIGISISVQQLGRIIDGRAQLWNQDVLEGLMTIFGCELSDLVS